MYRESNSSGNLGPALVAGFAVFLADFGFARWIGSNGWDDGAITLAFARTVSDSGQFALTPSSVEVEGFSSFAWLWLMAGLHSLVPLGVHGFVALSQGAAALCAALSAALLAGALAPRFGAVTATVLSTLVMCSPFAVSESVNGMEMALLGLLVLALVPLADGPQPWRLPLVFLVALAIPAVRFEAVAYLGVIALALLAVRRIRLGLVIGTGAALSFLGIALWRWARFGALVPNTITAKRWPPYSESGIGTMLLSRAIVGVELVLLALFVLLAFLLVLGRPGGGPLRRPALPGAAALRERASAAPAATVICVAYVLAVAAFTLAIGSNWGYLGRMQQSALPATVLVAAPLWKPAGRLLPVLARAGLVVVLLGIYVVVGPRASIAARLDEDSYSVTPQQYAKTGEAALAALHAAGKPSGSILLPDVGGSSLCCSELTIHDLALLANPELAEAGYGRLEAFLERERPDLVDSHATWSEASGIYGSPYFRENYRPVVTNGRWMWANRSLAFPPDACRWADVRDVADATYRGAGPDEEFIAGHVREPVCVLGEG